MWEKVQLKAIIEKPISGEWGDDGGNIKIIRTTNFTNNGILDLTDVVSRNIGLKKVQKKRLFKGDTIIEKSGGSPTQPVGRVVFFNEEAIYLCNNFTSIIRPKQNVFPKYLFWFLFNNHISKKTLKYQNKTTGIINLKLENYINEIEIPLPPLPIQEKIAAIIDKADELRRKDQELQKKYDELAQAIFIDMFGDPVKNEKGWEVKKLGELGKVITGNTPSREVKEYYGDFIEWIKTDNIIPTKIFPEKSKEQLSKEGLKVGRMVPNGSVLVTCIAGSKNSIGNCALANRELAFNQQINAFVPNTSNYVSVFLYYLFKLNKVYIQNSTTDGMKKIITKSSFEELIFIVPPILLQQAFVKKIELINELKAKTNTDKSEELFQSLLQRAFKGELVK